MPNAKVRKSNLELLRIAAILMIIGNHLVSHGILHRNGENAYVLWQEGPKLNRILSELFTPGGVVGVAIFFMLTGYFLISDDRIRIRKVAVETIFYGVLTALIMLAVLLFFPDFSGLSAGTLADKIKKNLLLPISTSAWWFASTYIILVLIHPFLNKVIRQAAALSRRKILLLLLACLVWYLLGGYLEASYYNLQKAILFYVAGAALKLSGKKPRPWLCAAGAALFWLLCAAGNYISDMHHGNAGSGAASFVMRAAVPFCACLVLAFFLSLRVGQSTKINRIAETTFGVYLLHDSWIGRFLIWSVIIRPDVRFYQSPLFLLFAVLSVLAVFAVCSLIDAARIALMSRFP